MYFGTAEIYSNDRNGDLIYDYTAVFEMDSNWTPFHAQVKVVPGSSRINKRKLRSQKIEVEDLEEETVRPHLKPIPLSSVYPLFPEAFLQATETGLDKCHIKPVDLSDYIEPKRLGLASRNLAKRRKFYITSPILAEAAIYEAFRKSPHPNILQYEGCIVRDGRIVALAFPELCETLGERIREKRRPIDGKKIYSEISAAVKHIHSLGFVHNDIKPMNIMLKEDGTAILIDFDTCARDGQLLIQKIPGPSWWCLGNPLSKRENDLHSLRRLEQYLNDPLHREQDGESKDEA